MIIQGSGIYFEWSFEEKLPDERIKNRIQTEIDGQKLNQVNESLTRTQLMNLVTSWQKITTGELMAYHSDFNASVLSLNVEREGQAIYLLIEVTEEEIQTNPTTTIGIDILAFTNDNLVEESIAEEVNSQAAQLFELEVELTVEELTEFISDIKENYDAL